MREVDIRTYWAEIVRDTEQFGQIAVAENPEFNRLSECIFRALEDSFLISGDESKGETGATEYGVERWESMLQIVPSESDTLDARKARILTYLNVKTPYTLEVLKQLLIGIAGSDNIDIDYVNDTQTLSIYTYDQFEDSVRDLTSRVIPMNLDVYYNFASVPVGYLECFFLQSSGTQYINTSTVMTSDTGLKMTYCSPSSGRMAFGVKKAENGIQGSFYSIHCYTSSSGAQHHWMEYGWGNQTYPLVGTEKPYRALPGEVQHCTLNWNNDGKWDWVCDRRDGSKSHLSGNIANKNTYTPPALNIFLWKINNNGATLDLSTSAKARVFSATIAQGDKIVRDLIPALSIEGAPCMLDKLSNTPFFNLGTGSFVVGFTLTQARMLKKLPATGGNLTISLPTTYQNDSDVMSAIAKAKSNGWTLSVQTYAANTVLTSTYSMERIWVRKIQDDNGNYVDSEGNRYAVEWCVTMYTPDESTPEDHGYELFRSVESAVAYWELEEFSTEGELK